MRVQRGGGGEDDEEHDEVREEHAGHHVGAGAGQLERGRAPPLPQRAATGRAVLLHLLGGLPEEQIRRDGGAQDADQDREVVVGPLDPRQQGGPQHRRPVGASQEGGEDVGEQHQGEPLEGARDLPVRGPEQQGDDEGRVERRPHRGGYPGHHRARRRHPAQVGPDVDDVGHDQERAGRPQHAARVAVADHARQTPAADHPEPRAHELHRGHEREGEQRGPEWRVPEGGARHRVGRDAGGIVVGRPGDEPRAELGEESPHPSRPLARLGSGHVARRSGRRFPRRHRGPFPSLPQIE